MLGTGGVQVRLGRFSLGPGNLPPELLCGRSKPAESKEETSRAIKPY